ncbi:uncharacterized protein LOC114965074 isoform X1 [Acropora millepora]|uniref:uncharacterized protein LOC114965074 isoform X1 n=2 Tax=Acropora millepora TaxID=45264 RepID=UPI001CF43F9E|nr:uncharacterized protein LOC114965074 isoform X1 [Acropora millepora]
MFQTVSHMLSQFQPLRREITMTRCSQNRRSFYVVDSVVPFEEDATHEFKGHRNIAVEELPSRCYFPGTDRRSRKAVSRNINAFLNTGKGGTVYLGIIDDGTVKGLHMSQYQKDHVTVSVGDLLSRYTPKVPQECYKVEFVPVLNLAETSDVELQPQLQDHVNGDMDSIRFRPHLLRTPGYCWCDRDAVEAFHKGIPSPLHVVEITVFPWKKENFVKGKEGSHIKFHPVYEDEEGNCYFRRQGSIVKYSLQDVVEFTKEEVHQHFKPLLLSIKEEMMTLKDEYNLHVISHYKTSAKGVS